MQQYITYKTFYAVVPFHRGLNPLESVEESSIFPNLHSV